ncbi:MAG: ribonuclease HI [Patiriisocius sp.]|jgi:ribonuclease HI
MKKVTVFTDGGARGNPGPSGIGVQILDDQNEVMSELSEFIGEATNNVAEYTAVKRALEHMLTLFEDSKAMQVDFMLDSQLVERQLNGAYKVKDATLKTFVDAIKKLNDEFAAVTFTHVRREENKEADRLANEAMDASA